MIGKRGKGQSWSLDVILAFVVFVLIISLFYGILNKSKTTPVPEKLNQEATAFANLMDINSGVNSRLSFINKGSVDVDRLETLYNSSYSSIKNQFGIKGDFCIYIVDQYGKLLTVNTSKGELVGFGNGNYSINDVNCGQPIN